MKSPSQTSLSSALGVLSVVTMILVIGELSVIFLAGLEWVTAMRNQLPWLVFGAPLIGVLTGYVYSVWVPRLSGRAVSTQVEMAQVVRGEASTRILNHWMAPLITIFTWLSHLGGLSVGREGTAMQMGSGIGASFARFYRMDEASAVRVVRLGLACGFAGVFGTPLAAAVFSFEWSGWFERDRRSLAWHRAADLATLLVFAYATHLVSLALGAHHAVYPKTSFSSLSDLSVTSFALTWLTVLLAVTLMCLAFIGLGKTVSRLMKRWVREPLQPFLGGVVLAPLFYIPFLRPYSGLGTVQIAQSFTQHMPDEGSALKMILTALSTAVGFKGGDVTPLFSIGASLGNVASIAAQSQLTHDATARLAADGTPNSIVLVFVGAAMTTMFAGVHRVPVAAAVMAYELFGWPTALVALISGLCVAPVVRRFANHH